MTTVLPTGFAQVTYDLSFGDEALHASIVIGHKIDDFSVPGDTLDALVGTFTDEVMPLFENSSRFDRMVFRYNDGTDVLLFDRSPNEPGTGGSFGTVPPQVACLVKKGTNLGGRTQHGRIYLPSYALPADSVTNGGIIDSDVLTPINTAMAAWLAALTTNGVDMYLLHALGDSSDDTPTEVQELIAQSEVATQRRRLRGR